MLTQANIDNIQIDYGILYKDFGLATEELIAPTRGGGTFVATKVLRDIEFDGRKGKTSGLQAIDEINAQLNVTVLNTSMDTLALALPYIDNTSSILTAKSENIGVIDPSKYLTNLTMFAKLISGGYKKITLYSAMNELDLTLAAIPKGEAEIALEILAHWDPTDDVADLYKIEDVASIGGDTTGPTVVTVPADAATGVVIGDDLTATFNEEIRGADVNSNNFVLIKCSDGSIVPGALSYVSSTKVVTFDPTSDLDASTDYVWVISSVRDLAGNTMIQVAVNFTTA